MTAKLFILGLIAACLLIITGCVLILLPGIVAWYETGFVF